MSDTLDASDELDWLSLDPDEEVVWTGQPAFETLYGTIATGLALTVVLIGLLILLGVPFSYLGIRNTDYVVTNQSLYVKKGVFSTNIETVDLDRIQNTEYNQSFWGKQFGYGTISISTAGSSGAEISFSGVPDAKDVRDRIMEVRSEHGGRREDGTSGGRSAAGESDAAPASAAQVDELISEVRATREAFERIEQRVTAEAADDRSASEPVAGEDGEASEANGGRVDADASGADGTE
jgi:uncharacterized membrane protein YdbT with pleckstrin-like domain